MYMYLLKNEQKCLKMSSFLKFVTDVNQIHISPPIVSHYILKFFITYVIKANFEDKISQIINFLHCPE